MGAVLCQCGDSLFLNVGVYPAHSAKMKDLRFGEELVEGISKAFLGLLVRTVVIIDKEIVSMGDFQISSPS